MCNTTLYCLNCPENKTKIEDIRAVQKCQIFTMDLIIEFYKKESFINTASLLGYHMLRALFFNIEASFKHLTFSDSRQLVYE